MQPGAEPLAVVPAELRSRMSKRAGQVVEKLQADLGHLVVEANLPQPGRPASSSYEGEGYVIVRHPQTDVVRDALRQIVDGIRVELVEAQ